MNNPFKHIVGERRHKTILLGLANELWGREGGAVNTGYSLWVLGRVWVMARTDYKLDK